MDDYQRQDNNVNGYPNPYGNANGYQQPNTGANGYQQSYDPNGYQQPNTGAGGYQQPYNPNGYQQPNTGAGGYQQPYDPNGYQQPNTGAGGYQQPYNPNGYPAPDRSANGYQPYNGGMNGAPVNGADYAGDMPNKTVYLVLMIVGFLCGILWGLLSIGPYNKMKAAIDANDSVTAKKNARKILIFAIIGIVLNALLLIGNMAQ